MTVPDPEIVVGALDQLSIPDVSIPDVSSPDVSSSSTRCGENSSRHPSKYLAFIDAGIPPRFDPVIDTFLDRLVPAGVAVARARVAGGEARKSLEGWSELTALCAAEQIDRDGVLIAIGGGALGDAVGFTASTWHRGVRWLAVPTTLVAMVDAHLGGKTALNCAGAKNQIGSFWWPESILTDPRFLETLPAREVRSGWGELIKSAWIGDGALVERWEESPPLVDGRLRLPGSDEIERASAVKRRIVAEDPRENDRRRVLNFGHTLGHALELLPGTDLAHGEAVAVGMAFAAEIATDLDLLSRQENRRLGRLLERVGYDLTWPIDRSEELLAAMATDKKHRSGQTWMALPLRLGEMAVVPVATEHLARRLARGAELAARDG